MEARAESSKVLFLHSLAKYSRCSAYLRRPNVHWLSEVQGGLNSVNRSIDKNAKMRSIYLSQSCESVVVSSDDSTCPFSTSAERQRGFGEYLEGLH